MRLPSIAGGRRSVLLARLIVYGLASAGLGLLLAGRIRHAFHAEAAPGSIGELAFSLLGLTILLFGLQVLEARDAEGLGQDYVVRVRQRLLASLARRTWSQADATGHGATMSRLIGDLNSLRNWVSLGVARMLSSGVALCGLILVLAQFRLRVAWMMFVVIGLILLAWKAMTPILRRSVREGRRLRGSLANRVWDQISHGPTRRLLGNGNLGLDRLLRLGKQMRRVLVRRATFSAILRRSPELAHGLALAGLLFLLSPSGASHAEDPGGFAAALFVIGMIIARLRDMARAWDYRVAYDEGTRRISRLLGEPTVEISKTAQPLPGEGPVALSLNGVGWSETGGGWTASAQAGERVLVIGESGSGKSMLARWLVRVADPAIGEIHLDGTRLQEIADLHQVAQLVSAELPLARGTVRQNLLGPTDSKDTQLEADPIVVAVGIMGDQRLFPEGLETRVGEGGKNLPSGVRARVQLARALRLRPRLLVIDEPTLLNDIRTARTLARALELNRATVLVMAGDRGVSFDHDSIWRLTAEGIVTNPKVPREDSVGYVNRS